MKNAINTEFEKIASIKSSAELYLAFFRLVQLMSCFGFIYALFASVSFLMSPLEWHEAGAVAGNAWIIAPICFGVARFLLAELALHSVRRKQFWGVGVGLLLAIDLISPWSFALSAFGFYCFLNPEFQRQYLKNSPEIFRNVLSTLGLNRIDTTASE